MSITLYWQVRRAWLFSFRVLHDFHVTVADTLTVKDTWTYGFSAEAFPSWALLEILTHLCSEEPCRQRFDVRCQRCLPHKHPWRTPYGRKYVKGSILIFKSGRA